MEVFFWDGPREISCHGLWTSSFKAIMFSFSQRTVVACRLFLSLSRRCLDFIVALGRPPFPSHLSWPPLFAQSTSWAHSEGLPASFTHFWPITYVLPSATFGSEFIDCTRSLAQLDFAQRRWGRHLLGWASGHAVRFGTLSLRVSTGRALALFGRLHSLSSGTRVPLPATVFTLSLHTPGTWAHWCLSLLQHHAAGDPGQFGVGPRCSTTVTRRWLQRVVCPLLDRAWLRRLWRGLALLSNVRFIPGVVRPRPIGLQLQRRFWHGSMVGLARHGHDPCPVSSAQRRCVFVCVLHQSSWRPHPLSDLLPRLCRLAYPVVCSSPRGTSRSLFMDACTLGFSIRRIWPTPAALCAHISSLLARCVPASILADGDVLIYDASSGKRSSKLLLE